LEEGNEGWVETHHFDSSLLSFNEKISHEVSNQNIPTYISKIHFSLHFIQVKKQLGDYFTNVTINLCTGVWYNYTASVDS
jgi:hypothetical protein